MFAKKTDAADDAFKALEAHLLKSFKDDEIPADDFVKILAEFNRYAALYYADKRGRKVSPDVLATIGANLAGILLILNHEKAGIVTSKAISFVQKLR